MDPEFDLETFCSKSDFALAPRWVTISRRWVCSDFPALWKIPALWKKEWNLPGLCCSANKRGWGEGATLVVELGSGSRVGAGFRVCTATILFGNGWDLADNNCHVNTGLVIRGFGQRDTKVVFVFLGGGVGISH